MEWLSESERKLLLSMPAWQGMVTYRRSSKALLVGLLLISGVAHSETDDVFMRAVGFALTGRDDVEPKAIDRANCIFAVSEDDLFHLNNVQVDRISIEARDKFGMKWTSVGLHGDDVVVEHTTLPMTEDIAKTFSPQSRQMHPRAFVSHREYELILKTSEVDRVKRAWEYIYSNGCIGKKSPF